VQNTRTEMTVELGPGADSLALLIDQNEWLVIE